MKISLLKNNRKFILALVIVGVGWLARLKSGDFANVLTAIGVAFMGGNAVEHWSNKDKSDGGD